MFTLLPAIHTRGREEESTAASESPEDANSVNKFSVDSFNERSMMLLATAIAPTATIALKTSQEFREALSLSLLSPVETLFVSTDPLARVICSCLLKWSGDVDL